MRSLQSLTLFTVLLTLGACTSLTVEEIHQQAIVLDAHADIEIPGKESRYVGDDGKSQVEPAKMKRGGTDAVVMAIAVGPGPRTPEGDRAARQQAEVELEAIQRIIADPANNLVLARTAADVITAERDGKQAYILGFQNARILEGDPMQVDYFFENGVRVFALTHMGHNDFADSSRPTFIAEKNEHEPAAEHGGLSPLGVQTLKRLNELGAVVDISQLSKQAAIQVITTSTAPVIASHSNVQALSSVSRNLSDEELDLLKANGGVIHIAPFRGYLFDSTNAQLDADIRAARRVAGIKEDYLYPFELYWELDDPDVQRTFLNTVSDLLGPGRIEDMVKHIDYVVERIGVDHVGIGTDFNHGSGIEGYDDASESINLTRALVERGYSAGDIRKIWGGNFLRVMREAAR